MAENLTDWLQESRFVVVEIDRVRGRLRVKGRGGACTDLSCAPSTAMAGDDDAGGLETLNPGDIVRVDGAPGRAERIVVLRRVWEELTSPEF